MPTIIYEALAADWSHQVAVLWFTILGTALAAIDIATYRLPNALTLTCFLGLHGLSLADAVTVRDASRASHRFAVSAAMCAAFFVVAVASRGALGMGDVKFAASVGAVVGWHSWVPALLAALLTVVVSGGWALILLARGSPRDRPIALGPCLFLAALAATFLSS